MPEGYILRLRLGSAKRPKALVRRVAREGLQAEPRGKANLF